MLNKSMRISEIMDELDAIRDAFNNSIVEFKLDLRLGYIYVELIRVRLDHRRKGIATQAFEALFEWCDKYNYHVCLWTTGEYGVPERIVNKFYEDLGFIYNRGKMRIFKYGYEYIRHPKR